MQYSFENKTALVTHHAPRDDYFSNRGRRSEGITSHPNAGYLICSVSSPGKAFYFSRVRSHTATGRQRADTAGGNWERLGGAMLSCFAHTEARNIPKFDFEGLFPRSTAAIKPALHQHSKSPNSWVLTEQSAYRNSGQMWRGPDRMRSEPPPAISHHPQTWAQEI